MELSQRHLHTYNLCNTSLLSDFVSVSSVQYTGCDLSIGRLDSNSLLSTSRNGEISDDEETHGPNGYRSIEH